MLSKDTIIEMVVGQLEKEAHRLEYTPSSEWVEQQAAHFCANFELSDEDIAAVIKLLREKIEVSVGEAAILMSDAPRAEWLTAERRKATSWYYWERFKKHFKTKDIPESVLKRTDTDTDRILSLLGDPKSQNGFPCRGMVIGDVQSGKTNNYSALINKAADAGYKLIIILTGTVEDLRQQTQERLDSDFVGSVSIAGRSSKDKQAKIIGVGRSDDSHIPFCLTDRNDDIKKPPRHRIPNTGEQPCLVVTKKNMHPLKHLVTWLTSEINSKNGAVDQPVLIIDDEADNASVNTGKEDEDPKTINRLIREVIHACRRVSYIAYTATPFANIFIHPESEGDLADTNDLFPKDFIVALEPPNNYCGAKFFFRNDNFTDKACIEIEDAGEHLPLTHSPGTAVHSIPASLKDSVGVFLLACAIKDIRRRKHIIKHEHDSMLINMSRLTTVQSDITPYVDTCLDTYWDAIEVNICKATPELVSDVIYKLYSLWKQHYEEHAEETWASICSSLSLMEKPKTITVHSKSGDTLTYDKDGPKKQIAIGGLKLSRGLTLEGLVVSYFYRRSVMYDSLMQMGRWYGYRDGYQDLLRIWITSESLDWYKHISKASDDLREQAAEMQRRNKTPREFGLRVQASPDALMVTAPNKMRNSTTITTRLRFDDRLWETDCVDSRPEVIQNNLNEFSKFLVEIKKYRLSVSEVPERHRQHMHFKDIPSDKVIKCLKNLHNHPSCGLWAESELFLQFLESRSADELALWNIFVYQLKGDKAGDWSAPSGQKFGHVHRSVVRGEKNKKNKNNPYELRLSRKQSITDKLVEDLGLSQSELEANEVNGEITNRIARDYRSLHNKNPSIIFHVIRACSYKEPGKKELEEETTVLGWAISIPQSHISQPDIHWEVNRDWFEKYGTELTDEWES